MKNGGEQNPIKDIRCHALSGQDCGTCCCLQSRTFLDYLLFFPFLFIILLVTLVIKKFESNQIHIIDLLG